MSAMNRWMDSNHNYASYDEHLSLSAVFCLFNAILCALVHLHQPTEPIFKCWSRENAKI